MQARPGLPPRKTISQVQQQPLADTEVKVTSEGRPYLGAALGTEEYIQAFVTDKVQQWARELEQLATIACVPNLMLLMQHSFIHGVTSR